MTHRRSVRKLLTSRGFGVASEGSVESEPVLKQMDAEAQLAKYADLLRSQTFRKLIRRLAAPPSAALGMAKIEQCCGSKTGEYVDFLMVNRLARREQDTVAGEAGLRQFGHHLEWFVASVLGDQFDASVAWNVKIHDLAVGGDFDVLAYAGEALLFIELKSARPDTLTKGDLRRFMQRRVELGPELAVLVIDTDGDISPVLQILNDVIVAVYRTMPTIPPDYQPEEPLVRPQPGLTGVSWGLRNTYVTSSHPSFETQIGRCLRFYQTFAKHQTYLGGADPNWLQAGVSDA